MSDGEAPGKPRRARARGAVAASCFLLLCPRQLPAQDSRPPVPPRSLSLPVDQVRESFLAYIVGLIDADVRFSLDPEGLLSALPEFRARRGDPFQLLRQVEREEGLGGQVLLSFGFPADMQLPIPVGIFGYHPISVSVSRTVSLDEKRYALRSIGRTVEATDVVSRDYEYRLADGYARFHFDDWLTFLTGGYLVDFSVAGVALFTDHGEWRALIAGRGTKDQVVCWLFDLKRTRPILRVPGPLLDLAVDIASPTE